MIDHRLDVGLDGDIRTDETRSIAKPLRKSLSSFMSSTSYHDLTARGNENLSSAGSDPTCRTRYDGDFP
jgi:hypothetical protein